MIEFDVGKIEPYFPEIKFLISNDDDAKPFLALHYKTGEFSKVIWSYTDINITVDDQDYVDIRFSTMTYSNGDDDTAAVDIGKDSKFINTVSDLLDSMLQQAIKEV
jgi:hypothetical protein